MSIDVVDAHGATQTINTLADLMAVVATATAQGTGNTALAEILAKLTADPSTNTTLAAAAASLATLVAGVKDNGPAWSSVWGVAGVPFHSADQHAAVALVSDIPTVGQHIVIDDLIVSVDTAMSVTFTEETSGTVIFGPWYLPANSGPIQLTPRGKNKLPTVNNRLQVQTSVAGNITVNLGYHSEA